MKRLFILLILLLAFSCKNTSTSEKDIKIEEEKIKLEESSSSNAESHNTNGSKDQLTFKINTRIIKDIETDFYGAGSKTTGLTNELSFDIYEQVFDAPNYRFNFSLVKNSNPPMLEVGKYPIHGFTSDATFNTKENSFYCVQILESDPYKKLQEEYKNLDKDSFIKVIGFDFVIIPDENNAFNITSIKEIKNSKEVTKISEEMSMIKNEFLITGDLKLKVMKVSSEKEFVISCNFTSEYNYSFSNF